MEADDAGCGVRDAGCGIWTQLRPGSVVFPVPGSLDIAIFDGSGTNDCAIDITVDVEGISILAGYSGEISQGAQEVTVGSRYFTQADGTYTCGSYLVDKGRI